MEFFLHSTGARTTEESVYAWLDSPITLAQIGFSRAFAPRRLRFCGLCRLASTLTGCSCFQDHLPIHRSSAQRQPITMFSIRSRSA
jgi:hypothetical protein